MTPARRTLVIGVAGMTAFFLHWFAIALTVGRPPALARTVAVADAYAEPLFRQRWRLFAPEPSTMSRKLLYRCADAAGAWAPWQTPVDDLLARHYRWRISHHGKLVRIPLYHNRQITGAIARATEDIRCDRATDPDGVACARARERAVHESAAHREAARYAARRCAADLGRAPRGVQLRVEHHSVAPPGSHRSPAVTFYQLDPVWIGGAP